MAGTPSQLNRGFRYVKNIHGGEPVLETWPVVAGVTYWNGNCVTVSGTSGSVRVLVAADTSIYGVCSHSLGTAVAADQLIVYPFRGGNVFEAKAAAGMSGGKPENYVGQVFDLKIATATYHRLDTAASTKVFLCVGYNPDDKAKATQGLRYWLIGRPVESIASDSRRH